MNKLLFAAPLLLAAAAYEKAESLLAPPAPLTYAAPLPSPAAPAARPAGTSPQPFGTTSVDDVVTAANAFLATLSTTQQAAVVLTRSQANVIKWSNLPCGAQCRNGLQLSTLTSDQVAAALAVVQAATGTTANEGYSEAMQIRAADDILSAASSSGGGGGGPGGGGGGGGYSSGIYFIAFLGTPSATGTWQLQFGGHHLAINTTFKDGAVAGATPLFEGVEPKSFTVGSDATIAAGTYAPLSTEQSAMAAMLAALSTTQLATAKLSQTFSDVSLGPNNDGNFPTTKVGLPVSALSADQQALVLAAMQPWVQDADDATAAALLTTYQNQLASTYIAYSGNATLANNADYVRIDGPNVWIEFVCQSGVVYQNQIHYHSIWRDHARDYGGDYYTTVTGTKAAAAAETFSVYPNPVAGGALTVQLTSPATAASYTVRNTLGQTVGRGQFKGAETQVPTTGLAAGVYLLNLEVAGKAPVTHRFVLK